MIYRKSNHFNKDRLHKHRYAGRMNPRRHTKPSNFLPGHTVFHSEKKLFRLYLFLLFITLILVGTTLNRLELGITVQQLRKEGIDYDSFRELIVPVQKLQEMEQAFNQSSKQRNVKSDSNSQDPGPADYITISMLLSKYDLSSGRTAGKRNMNYLIGELRNNKSFMELKSYYQAILADIKCFPVAPDDRGRFNITFTDTWNQHRSYGGNRRHEGTDLMSGENIRGEYPVISMTGGTVEKMGWLEQGGYRIGIRGTYGAYFYYAHLESYAKELKVGDTVKAGQFLGYMGDSGYGSEGTVGKFDVHLHVGVYVETGFGELSVNPYWILRYLETLDTAKTSSSNLSGTKTPAEEPVKNRKNMQGYKIITTIGMVYGIIS